jgi:hypothetical protein
MLKTLIRCVCLMMFACQSEPKSPASASQKRHSQKLLSRIDILQTDAQVMKLIEGSRKHYRPFNLHTLDTVLYRQLQDCADCSNLRSWTKADFDGNGLTDLLVFGAFTSIVGTENTLLCLLNSGKSLPRFVWIGGPSEQRLGSEYFANNMVPWVIEQKPKALVGFARRFYNGEKGAGAFSCRLDTLILSDGKFIEYNAVPGRRTVQSIELKTGSCYGNCPVFKMTVNRWGEWTMRR